MIDRQDVKQSRELNAPDRMSPFPFPMPEMRGRKAFFKAFSSSSAIEWQKKFVYADIEQMFITMNKIVGIPPLDNHELNKKQCITCIAAETKQASIKRRTLNNTKPCEGTHTDMTGKTTPRLLGKAQHFVVSLEYSNTMSAVCFTKKGFNLWTA